MKKIIFILSMLSCASQVYSSTLTLQSYPAAREIFRDSRQEDQYVLALGVYKKVGGRWQADKSQQLSGLLERTTLELPTDHSAEKGFGFYKDQLSKYKPREIFYCQARDCGTSNSWANNHFKILQLYGLDRYQFYGAYEITNADVKPVYVVLYAVTRGNKRTYVQLDILHLNKVNDFSASSKGKDR